MSKLKFVNPLYWQEKTAEYVLQDTIEPSWEAKLKVLGTTLPTVALYLTIVPVIYSVYKRRNPETIKKIKENISKSLLERGYSLDEMKFVGVKK